MLKTLSLLPEGERDAENDDSDGSETRMLRALEAMSSQLPSRSDNANTPPRSQQREQHRENSRDATSPHHRARHRFVKDGEIPVVHVAPPRPRDTLAPPAVRDTAEHVRLQQMIDEQRQRADQAERAKAEAQTQLRVLQTKFAHAEMALSDVSAIAEARLREIDTLQDQLRQLTRPEPMTSALAAAPRPVGRPRRIPLPTAPASDIDALQENEPEPVQWWLTPAPVRRGRS